MAVRNPRKDGGAKKMAWLLLPTQPLPAVDRSVAIDVGATCPVKAFRSVRVTGKEERATLQIAVRERLAEGGDLRQRR
jgi:hypothetical protein